MARSATTWKAGQGGKPKGAKDTVPRSFKASVKAVYEELMTNDPQLIKNAILRGLTSRRPKEAFLYVQLAAHYMDGPPKQSVELTGDVNLHEQRELVVRIANELDGVAARLAARGAEPPSLAE